MKLFKKPFRSEKNNDNAVIPENFRGILQKHINKYTLSVLLALGATKMQSQQNPDLSIDSYSALKTVIDYEGDADTDTVPNGIYDGRTIREFYETVMDSLQNEALNMHTGTQYLTGVTRVNSSAQVPANVYVVGNLELTTAHYSDWVMGQSPYTAPNNRASLYPTDINITYGYQYSAGMSSDLAGAAYGNGTGWSTFAANYDMFNADPLTPLHEGGAVSHCTGQGHNHGKQVTLWVDEDHDNTYSDPNDGKTLMKGGLAPGDRVHFSTCKIRNNTQDSYVYTTLWTDHSPARISVADLDNGNESALDNLYSRVIPGGAINSRVFTTPVPASLLIANKTPEISINGNIITVTNMANLQVNNQLTNLPEKLQLFVYRSTDNAINHQIPRNINGYSQPNVGFYLDPANPTLDLTGFLTANNLTMSQVDFHIGIARQNSVSLLANETLGIQNEKIAGLKIYPNPSKGQINISTDQTDISKIMVYNQAGQKIFTENYDNQTVRAELHIKNRGLYFIKVVDNQGHISVVKHIVNAP